MSLPLCRTPAGAREFDKAKHTGDTCHREQIGGYYRSLHP